MTDDLAAFIAARYDEAEAVAKATAPSGRRLAWKLRSEAGDDGTPVHWVMSELPGTAAVAEAFGLERGTGQAVAAFIAANDPAHRLRDIALKRAILALHQPELIEVINADQDERSGWFCKECGGDWPCATVRQLGTEFSACADYRAEWKP